MIGVFINGKRLSGWGYEYTFDSIEEAKKYCDPYGYMNYEYREVENAISLHKLVDLMIERMFI